MAAIASEEWLAALIDACSAIPQTPGASGSIAMTVENSPAGKVGWTETVVDGVSVAAEAPALKSADIVLTAKFGELLAMFDGECSPAVMFMQGRLKLSGDMGLFLALLPAMESTEASAARTALAAVTDR